MTRVIFRGFQPTPPRAGFFVPAHGFYRYSVDLEGKPAEY